jgi:DNA-binding transcriptional LysR family regulator
MGLSAINIAGISVERLVSFCDIVDAGSVVAAARKSGVAQGQYSRQIRDLERALEAKLFEKEGRFLRLTKDGVKLGSLTRAYFAGLSEMSGGAGSQRALKMGAAESIMRWVLVPRYSEVLLTVDGRLDVENHRTNRIIELVLSGGLDLGIVRSDAVTDELEATSFPALRYALMVPRRVLPDKSATGIRSVGELPFVLIDGDGRFVRSVIRLMEQNELPLKVVARVESFNLAVELAKVMSAATIIPMQAASEFAADQFASVEIEGMGKLDRALSVVVSKRTAELSTRARRVATRLGRLFNSASLSEPSRRILQP